MSARKLPGRGMGDKRSSFARSFFTAENAGGDGEEVELDENVPVPKARPLGRLASRRNLSIAKRPSIKGTGGGGGPPSQRGIAPQNSGDSVTSAAASLTSAGARGSLTSPVAVAAAPPRNAEESYLRQSMLRSTQRSSGGGGGGGGAGSGGGPAGFDMEAIHAALKEDEALEAGFDDEEVLEQYRIMAQHEATLRVKANTGFDMADYEKRRKATGSDGKDKKEMFGGGKKPHLGLPPPQHVIVSSSSSNGGMSAPPVLNLDLQNGNISENYRKFMQEQQRKEEKLSELSQGEKVRSTDIVEGDHVVRCWGCKINLRVNYVATLVHCPDCGTVSQARKRN